MNEGMEARVRGFSSFFFPLFILPLPLSSSLKPLSLIIFKLLFISGPVLGVALSPLFRSSSPETGVLKVLENGLWIRTWRKEEKHRVNLAKHHGSPDSQEPSGGITLTSAQRFPVP